MRIGMLLIAVPAFALSGCVASNVMSVVTAPVKAGSKMADWATTSQDEADRAQGRQDRKYAEQERKEAKQARKRLSYCESHGYSYCN
jgi:hypothetical protein